MIAHEINNILTPFGSYAALALKHIEDKDLVKKALEKAVLNAKRAGKVMESMLSMANGQSQEKTSVLVTELIEDVFTCLCRDFQKDGIHVKIKVSADLRLHAVAIQIQQVLMNLILNAREAMLAKGGTLTISARKTENTVSLVVSDTGSGIAQQDLDSIFKAFYSNKDSKQEDNECFGTGLGLAFSRLVIDSHEGTLSVESQVSKGTTFTIALPQAPDDR
jgi:signal transduction histidine kinase